MADRPAIRSDVAVGEALKAIARDTLSEARRALEDQQRPDALAVHDYRKAMKRWRSLLRLLQPFLGEDGHRLRIEARDFARELSGARDAQSAIEALQDLSVLQGFTIPHAALAPWRSRLMPPILARQATHAKAAQRIAGWLLAERPKAFRRRIEALWEQGRR